MNNPDKESGRPRLRTVYVTAFESAEPAGSLAVDGYHQSMGDAVARLEQLRELGDWRPVVLTAYELLD